MFLYQLSKDCVISLSSTGIRTESVDKIKWSSQQVFQNTFSFPKQYGGKNMGIMLSKDQLTEVVEVSGVTDADGNAFDFMDPRVNPKCAQLLSSPEKVNSCNAILQLSDVSRETLLVNLSRISTLI